MYINQSQAQLIFDLVAQEDEKLSLGNYRLNFMSTREALVELLEKIAPTLKEDGWNDDPKWTAQAHRKALEEDREEIRENLVNLINSSN